MKSRILVSDDEISGRVTMEILLKKMMGRRPYQLDMASTLDETKDRISENYYDIIFLDIKFKNSSSFDILDRIPRGTKIVFVTAYSEHAIHAIRSNAFDYLLKPVKEEELGACLDRFYAAMAAQIIGGVIQIREKGFTRWFKLSEIIHVRGNGPYSLIHTTQEQITTARTLKSLIPDLGKDFIRIHKSHVVNRNYIKGFLKDQLVLTNHTCLPISRNGIKNLNTF